jgi:dihydrofolate reductase
MSEMRSETRSVIFMMSVSLDGFMEGPDRSIDWHLVDAEVHAHLNEWLSAAGAFLDGRVTWELMAGFWPLADHDPAATPTVVEFARIWREMPKIVYSRTLDPEALAWNTTLARSVVGSDVERLKASPGGDLVVGGAELAAEFMRHDLIDEYRVYVHPVLIGRGKRMFLDPDLKANLTLVESRVFGNGVVMLRYQRSR